MADRIKVGVAGASGYIGSELVRLLSVHPQIEVAWVTSESHAGKRVHEVFPNLRGFVRDEFVNWNVDLCADVQAVCLCLPHGGAMAAVSEITQRFPQLKVVDASGDFRSPVLEKWEHYYKTKHTAPELQARFAYGCPEFNREKIRAAQYVASPGCFATSINLLLAPFARHGELVGEVCVTGITGSSGAGNKPVQTTHHPERGANVRAYKVLEHQHLVEVVPFLEGLHEANDFDLYFVPESGPWVRGIFTTAFIPLNNQKSMATFNELIRDAYQNEPFVHVVKDTPEMRLVVGSNNAHVAYRAQGDMMVGLCAVDNLVKGGAGQAVQNLNLLLGLEETSGLMHPAGYV